MSEQSPLRITGPSGREYVIVGTLGSGGEGRVFRCETGLADARLQVVVKQVPHQRLGHAGDWLARAEGLVHVASPGLVRVHAAFLAPAPQYTGSAPVPDTGPLDGYVVMEAVTGRTLVDEVLDQPDLPLSSRLRILTGVATALDDLHTPTPARPGFVHGDVKPSNVVLDQEGFPVLVDLGGMIPVGGTPEGVPLSSAPYAAPELPGHGFVPTPSSDRFAFYAMTVHVLTGVAPIAGPDGCCDVAATLAAIASAPDLIARPHLAQRLQESLTSTADERTAPLASWVSHLRSTASETTRSKPGHEQRRPGSRSSSRSTTRRRGLPRRVVPAVLAVSVGLLIIGIADHLAVAAAGSSPQTRAAEISRPSTPPPVTNRPTPTPTTPTPKQKSPQLVPPGHDGEAGTGTEGGVGGEGNTFPDTRATSPTGTKPSPKARSAPRPKASAINNPQPWVSGTGSFDVSLDCGAWKTDTTKLPGIEFRSCANRTGQIITAGVEVASTDGRNHRVVPAPNAWTCVDGPGKCDDLGSANASVNGVLFPAGSTATIGPSSPWTLEVSADVTWGPHRCLGVTASLGGSTTVVSPFRLDWNQVKNDTNAGTTPEWTCPTPSSFG